MKKYCFLKHIDICYDQSLAIVNLEENSFNSLRVT